MATDPSTVAVAQAAQQIALQMLERPLGSLGAKVALARRLGLMDEPVERALNTLRKLRNAFAHSAESASLADPAHSARLAEVYADARANPLWSVLERLLAEQVSLDPALRDYILLITILVAFLEAIAQQLTPFQPPVVMPHAGLLSVRDHARAAQAGPPQAMKHRWHLIP